MATYSFLNVQATIAGPGGVFAIGSSAGVAEEGITTAPIEDKEAMVVGADGAIMHSLHAGRHGQITVRLLKTSPTNAMLMTLYNLQTQSSALHGRNTLTITDLARGDMLVGQEAAFARRPTITFAKEGGIMEWLFNVGRLDEILGTGELIAA